MPYFSVIIPTYNRKDHLKKTIESLLPQTFEDFELIIADDGSTDGTEAMVKSIKANFPIHHYWQKNKGRSAARNLGLSYARGKVALFIDDHVYADKRLLEEHFLYHAYYEESDYQIIRGFAPVISTLDDVPKDQPYQDVSGYVFPGEQNPFRSFFTGNVSINKKALLKVEGFDENFREYGFQDSELGYRLKKAGYKIKVNPNAIVYVFSVGLSFEERCDKSRQAGHSAVQLFKKFPHLGMYVGINPVNLFIYWAFSVKDNYLLNKLYINKLTKVRTNTNKYKKIQGRIRYYHFLQGMWEKLFNTKKLKEYYEKKNTNNPVA